MDSKKHIFRHIESYAFDENLIGRHMVFIAGPRQTGKTRLAKQWLEKKACSQLYFNWDDIGTRQAYRSDSRFFESPARSVGIRDPWIAFDEIHKRSLWRDILKGAYDIFGEEFRFLITGSARLDLFRKSGDSLVGRYNLFHMMPLCVNEITDAPVSSCFLQESDYDAMVGAFKTHISHATLPETSEACESLKRYGPFPEPFLKQNERFCRKWHQDYISLLIREDMRDISKVVELDKIEALVFLLVPRIMSPLSMPNLAGELEAAHSSVKSWLEQLKRLYLIFPVSPWSKKISRGLKKAKKWYFFDWYYVPDEAARLENMIAVYLYRTCQALTDMGYGNYSLHYIRTLEKREIDFVITRDNTPLLAVEVKTGETRLSATLRDRNKWLMDAPTIGVQVVGQKGVFKKHANHTWIISVDKFLSCLA
jgi:predicted AAA+ superfamily ATPase